MNATIAETLIGQNEIGHEKIGNDYQIYHQIVEVDSADDSMIFTIVDLFMVLLVYLGSCGRLRIPGRSRRRPPAENACTELIGTTDTICLTASPGPDERPVPAMFIL